MKKKKSNVNNVTIISFIIVLLVLGISIGWSSFNTSLHIDSMAMVRIKSDVRVTGFNYVTGTSDVLSSNENYNVNKVFGNVTLPNANSTAKYRVEITNMELASNVHMGINSLTGLPSNLKIVSIEDYTLKTKICDDNDSTDCSSGSQKTFYITIGYKDGAYDANNTTSIPFNIDVEFKKVYDITYTGFSNPPSSPTTVMDGDTVTITFTGDARDDLNVISGGSPLVLNTNYTYVNKVLTFITPIRDNVYIVNPSTYTITYELNGGVQAPGQITTYSSLNPENILAPTKEGATFGGWYEENDFSGEIITSTSQLMGNATLYASWGNGVARIGSTYYSTLGDAILAVPTNDVETTVILLANVSEYIEIKAHQNVKLNLQNFTLSNSGSRPVIETYGVLTMTNGTISTSASQGAINVFAGGTMYMRGGTINVTATGARQAIYVAGGTLNMSGGTLHSISSQRAALHNAKPNDGPAGTVVITGGTITATNFNAVVNVGTLTIGSEDGVAGNVPVITGSTNGVNSTTNYAFYDGIIKGKTAAVNDENKITDTEDGYSIQHSTEKINNVNYHVISFLENYTVTFNPNGGTVSETTRIVRDGTTLGSGGALPTPTWAIHSFDGWFTSDSGGREIDVNEVITGDIEFFAHWTDLSQVFVAKIGDTGYNTLQAAINAAPSNVETTITLTKNHSENVTVASGKNIVFDFGSYTLSNSSNTAVITNKGTTKIISGTFTSNSENTAVINNDPNGNLTISGGTVTATGLRQAVYNDKGTVYITGGTFSASALVEEKNKRGTIQNLASSTIYITGGTITTTAADGIAFTNLGTVTIGDDDGTISNTTPSLRGITAGVNNTGTLSFYDGIIKGVNNIVSGTIANKPTGSHDVNGTEVINNITYNTLSLEAD